ncbi:MAG: SIR2 family protein [Thermosipho sp. (in: Bacteria)]|nr:SIR2 family protein [Thermosipho sp. (in: thermotogales)]
MSDYILKELYEENQNNNLVIFIGSGISKYYSDPPEEFPDWKMIIDELKKGLNIDFSKNEDYLRIAQIFEDKYNRNELINVLNKLFPKDVEPGELHELLFEIGPAHIITTNYDNLIEKVLENETTLEKSYKKSQYQVLKKDQDFPHTLKHSNFIVKAHGDLKQRNIVLTERDYLNYHKNFPLFLSFLKYIFAKYRVLFVGFSLTDPNFIKILEDVKDVLGDNSIKHVAIMHESISEEEKLYFNKKSIMIVTKNEVEEFLKMKEKDNTKYLIEYFKFLQAGYTSTRPLNIFQFLERILNVGFLRSFNFIYKDILKNVWREQGIIVIDDNLWEIGSIELTGANASLYRILEQISNEEDVDCAMMQLLKESNVKSDENNINKLKELIINVLSLLLKSNIVSVNKCYVPNIIRKLRKAKEKIKEQDEKEVGENKKEEPDDIFKFLTYVPDDIKMDDNSVDVDIKDYTDSSVKIDGVLWKEIFEKDNFFTKYLRGKEKEALVGLLNNVNKWELSDGERFLLLYRIRHLCRISGNREETCLSIPKEIKNILEDCDKITYSIIDYLDQDKFISSFQEFVNFRKILLENNSNRDNELKNEFYVEYSSVLKFIISNKLPVLHYLKIKYLIKSVLEYFFKEVYGKQNNDIFDIPEWIIIGILFLDFGSFNDLIKNYYNPQGNVRKVKLSEITKKYLRKTLEKMLEKEIDFSKNHRVIYPENLVLLLLHFSSEEEDIELFVKYWKRYILAIQSSAKTSSDMFEIFENLIKNIGSSNKNINQCLAKYISKYEILDDYVEIFLSNNRVKINFLEYLIRHLKTLSSRKIKISCNNKLVNKLGNFFNKEFEDLTELNFVFYIFLLCKVRKNKMIKMISKIADSDFSKEIEDSDRFNLIEYLEKLYTFEKALGIKNTKLTTDFMLEKALSVLKYELKVREYSEHHVEINAIHFLVDLILNEQVEITEEITNEIEEIIKGYLDEYEVFRKFGGLLPYGNNFWNYFSIICLYFLTKDKGNELREKIETFFEDFWSDEKIKFIISTIKDSIYKNEMLKLLRKILCKVDKRQVFKEMSWLLDLMCEEK